MIARSIGGSKPNTAITSGPTGATTSRDPEFKLEASKDEASATSAASATTAWAPCEGNPHKPGPLADGPYTLEARAVDAVGADETPAKRDVRRRHRRARPRRSPAARAALISDTRPGFFFSANEAGARFECRLEGLAVRALVRVRGPDLPAERAGRRRVDVRGARRSTPPATRTRRPRTLEFTIDTTPPVTVIDGITAQGARHERATARAPTASGAGSTVALGGRRRGRAGTCPARRRRRPATARSAWRRTPPTARAAQVRAVPSNTITLARVEFSAQPGQTVDVRLPLSMTRAQHASTASAGWPCSPRSTSAPAARLRGGDVVLTPDPRDRAPARRRPHGEGQAAARRSCGSSARRATPAPARAPCGSARATAAKFSIKRRAQRDRPRPGRKPRRGKEVAVLLKTRPAPAKRLTLTLRAQEARR